MIGRLIARQKSAPVEAGSIVLDAKRKATGGRTKNRVITQTG